MVNASSATVMDAIVANFAIAAAKLLATERHTVVKFIYIDPETGQKHKDGSRFSDPGEHKAA